MKCASEILAYGVEQTVIFEPNIVNNRHWYIVKVMCQLNQHLGRLFQCCLKPLFSLTVKIPDLLELDINPLLVSEPGCKVVDARLL